jgi:hypothetical protein
MITWKLWSALQHPPNRHPVFRRIIQSRPAAGYWHMAVLAILGLVFSYICYQASFLQPPVRLVLLSLTFQDVLVIFVGFNLIYGCILAAGVSLTIARAREQGLYDALCLTPSGAPGINWAMCTAVLYRRPGFSWFRFAIIALSIIPILALLIQIAIPILVLGSAAVGRSTYSPAIIESYAHMLLDLTYAITLIIGFYASSVQSIIMSVILGILTSFAVRDASARIVAIGVFLLLQVFSFLLAFVFSLVILPAAYQLFHASGWLVDIGVPLLRLTFFFLLRELINFLLWRTLTRHLNSDLDLHTTLGGGAV